MENFTEHDSGNLSSFSIFLHETTYYLWLTVPPVLLVLGCFGNVMTIVVMRAMRASESTACLSVYFTALALSDLCLNVSFMLGEWSEIALNVPVKQFHDATCAISFFLSYVTSMTSAWFLMAMTCQRMMSVIVPHRIGVLCTVKTAKIVTVAVIMIGCMMGVEVLINYRVEEVSETTRVCRNMDENMSAIFFVIALIISSVLPSVFLIIANTILIRAVIQSVRTSQSMIRKREDQAASRSAKVSSMTVTLILTSVAFFVLSLPVCIADIYLEEVGFYGGRIEDEEMNAKLALFQRVTLLLWMGNSSVNFYIYVLSGKKFREETRRYLCLPF